MSIARNPGVMDPKTKQAVFDCTAGSVGGIGQVFAGQPFDTIKVRMQTQPHLYKGTLDCLKKSIANDGVLGLYKGTLSPLMGVGLCVSIQFFTMEHMKRTFHTKNNGLDLTMPQLFISGATAGIANSIVSGPVEHVRTRLQVQTAAVGGGKQLYSGTFDCIKQIYGQYGLLGLYKGQAPTLVREFFGYGAYFSAYEFLVQKELARTGLKRDQLPSWQVCLYGSAAGFSMWLSCYPIDAIKSKIQTDGFGSSRKYNGMFDCLRKTLANEGVGGLFRGLSPCLLRAAPANAATFIW
ncbi:hypothetical protein BB559_004001 [Furculomyces boomerangus]|uniref:Mitochondrial carrier n=2 Tax=Harpellales TaxID=61421 RepID=A0A2T9Y8F9_9FUNG|nr:hypothetical protein BB559_005504 [Furculomyces boomerangus]PVU91715.1 hypothetical protein BB559_004001 [Furculomyces boomerangus]PVZ98022.1 hypothetical protein BB558_005980 [Smittium angustum]PVZ98176.1 hypothetical protein BB558_005814 [Smittium angustum]